MASEDNFEAEDSGQETSSESGFIEETFESAKSEEPLVTSKKRKLAVSPSQKRKKKEKPPTVEELRNWKETENLYSSCLFRLQIEELVSELKIKNKRRRNLDAWLESFSAALKSLPEYSIPLSSIKAWNKRKMTSVDKFCSKLAEYPQLIQTDQDLLLRFTPPEVVEQFGLYAYNSLPGPELALNLNIVIPKDCFDVKDYLNNRYLFKRYYYLTYIAEHLKSGNIVKGVEVSFHECNSLLPVLQLKPNGCDKTLVTVYATPASDTFRAVRFLPEVNNVKQDVFGTGLGVEVLRSSATIFYNSALGYDVTLSVNTSFAKQILEEQSNVQEAVKLLCVWLRQHQFMEGVGSFTETLLVYFIVYLLVKKKINKFMSSYQVVRSFWSFIETSDLENNSLSLADVPTDTLDGFKKHFAVVCLDRTGTYNVAAFLNLELFKKVQAESRWALQCLNENKSNTFQYIFLVQRQFYLQYDLVIDLSESLPLQDRYQIEDARKAKYVGYQNLCLVEYVTETIKKAFGKRVLHLVPRLEVGKFNRATKFFYGINLNPEEAFGIITLGPALNDHVAATEFRKFWGDLASDRRFRDGSTNVAVYFKTNTVKARRNIIMRILDFVLGEKLDLKSRICYNKFDDVLVSKKLVPSYPSGTNEETCLKIIQASDELGKKLRALQMSLKVTGVQGVSDVFNYSELFPPIPANYEVSQSTTAVKGNNLVFSGKKPGSIPRYVQPVECVLQLEHSSKWPSTLQALRHVKTAFYLEISVSLQTSHGIISHATPDFLDVYFEGVVFRYRLFIPKELALVKKETTDTGLVCYKESQDSFEMETSLSILPRIAGALKGLQSMYPSWGPGTALVKRWLRSQLIDNFYFPDIVINLVSASLYLNNTFPSANTPQIAFLRFLKFFAEFDWNLQPVLVNFNDELSKEDITELETKLQENRTRFPLLYILTPFDEGCSVFTRDVPNKEILSRVKELARASLSFVTDIVMGQNHVGVKELFIPNFQGYNVVIHLEATANPRRYEQIVFAKAEDRIVVEKYQQVSNGKLPVVGFDPVEKYLETLRKCYGKFALFFHDSYGGNAVGVLWRPEAYETVDFKADRVAARMPAGGKIAFNVDAVIEDFYVLGKDLVRSIDKR
ncbi:hypothetical protein NQ315_012601 [Exocentrus adspersus]|uniref:Nucleolar protein 6 n=1 Tax=Exocentrus adspersus TaxID=1586481 RepID=A0AAV8VTQ9_9CUCU|nr:hypothetical protein NQ315_012601 [Exocentrus adspersus]